MSEEQIAELLERVAKLEARVTELERAQDARETWEMEQRERGNL